MSLDQHFPFTRQLQLQIYKGPEPVEGAYFTGAGRIWNPLTQQNPEEEMLERCLHDFDAPCMVIPQLMAAYGLLEHTWPLSPLDTPIQRHHKRNERLAVLLMQDHEMAQAYTIV